MKRSILFSISLILCLLASSQPASNYYASETLNGKSGRELELALKAIIYPHTRYGYDDLWQKFETTDPGPADSIPAGCAKTDLVYDMYAWMQQFPKFYSDKCRTQTGGINREHVVPNSWWGGKDGNAIAYTDLHHLTPADGCANSVAKNDYPLGEYKSGMEMGWPTQTKQTSDGYTYVTADNSTTHKGSASHRWDLPTSMQSSYGGAGNLFEPADEYKGDFARMYLYVVCAYEKELVWKTNYMFTSSDDSLTTINEWARDLLLKWCRQDPVSDKERDRNNAVYSLQGNRNPFIDYPEFVEYIWGNKSTTALDYSTLVSAYSSEYKQDGGTDSGVTDPVEDETIELTFHPTTSFVSGKHYLIVYNDTENARVGSPETLTKAYKTMGSVALPIENRVITADQVYSFVISGTTDSCTIQNQDYSYWGTTSSYTNYSPSSVATNWTVGFDDQGNAVITDSENGRHVVYFVTSSGDKDFRFYKVTGGNPVQLYVEYLPGDVNWDGKVNTDDVFALVDILTGGDQTPYDLFAADVNQDNRYSIADITALINLILTK